MKRLSFILLSIIFVQLLSSCKKEEEKTIPILTTTTISEIQNFAAKTGGTITSDGNLEITQRGVCWGLNSMPTIADSTTNDGTGAGTFTSNLTNLKSNTTYYVRAYATNSLGTGYGDEISFTTSKIERTESVTLSAGYANDVYYSFTTGVVATTPRASWDIAFSVSTRSSSILINESAGVELKVYPNTTTWPAGAVDITNYANWTSLRNSNTDWEEGAFNANATGHPNYGWGIYDMNTHNIDGAAVYIIKLRNGSFKKIMIEKKYSSLQKYSFRYANVDGTGEVAVSDLILSNSKANYVYYDLSTNTRLDREPDASTWDLLFTKWEDINNNQPYIVTGVLQNIGVKAIDITTSTPATVTYTNDQFVSDINTIGYDWKLFNNSTYTYDVATNRVFIVKDNNNKVFKQIFTGFAMSTGTITFTIAEQ